MGISPVIYPETWFFRKSGAERTILGFPMSSIQKHGSSESRVLKGPYGDFPCHLSRNMVLPKVGCRKDHIGISHVIYPETWFFRKSGAERTILGFPMSSIQKHGSSESRVPKGPYCDFPCHLSRNMVLPKVGSPVYFEQSSHDRGASEKGRSLGGLCLPQSDETGCT